MSYRLGEYECAQCGHRQPAGGPKEERAGSGPGFRKEQQWGGGASQPSASKQRSGYTLPGQYQGAPVAPPPPPPGSQMYGQQDLYGGVYDTRPAMDNDSLETEKKVYFGIQAVFSILLCILIIIGLVVLSRLGEATSMVPGMGGFVVFMGIAYIIGNLIGLAILWQVLFGDQTWLKWTCLVAAGFGLLLTFGSFFTPAVDIVEGQIRIISGIMQLALSGWYISILWRDIQRQQGY